MYLKWEGRQLCVGFVYHKLFTGGYSEACKGGGSAGRTGGGGGGQYDLNSCLHPPEVGY